VVEGEGAQWIEQAGKGGSSAFGASVGWTSWEGGSGNLDASKLWSERAPAELQLKTPGFKRVSQAGARSGLDLESAQFSAAPFPACSTHSDVSYCKPNPKSSSCFLLPSLLSRYKLRALFEMCQYHNAVACGSEQY